MIRTEEKLLLRALGRSDKKVSELQPLISRSGVIPWWQMAFNSRLLKLNDDADIMEELKGLAPEQLKALIAMVKKS